MRDVAGPTDCDPDRPVVTDKDADYDKADETHVLQACNQRRQSWMNYLQTADKKVDTGKRRELNNNSGV